MIEAGLGGRYDATNVIPSRVQVLTSVGLEHTRWLGPTIADIAREKLDVVQPGGTLVLGPGLHPDARGGGARGRRASAARGSCTRARTRACQVGALGAFQRRNFALAARGGGGVSRRARRRPRRRRGCEVRVPGPLQIVGGDPLTLLDGAHNPDGIAALVESLPEIVAGRDRSSRWSRSSTTRTRRRCCGCCCRACDALVLTSSQNPRALPPPTLQSLAGQLGGPPSELVRDPRAALRARARAGRRRGVVLATGSIYLVADLLRPATAGARLDAVNDQDDNPSFLTMIGLVALIVAVVILVFFGIGYLFGRVFL